MPVVSVPIEPVLPDEAAYPPSRLQRFIRHNRATYQEKHGEQAPVWNKEHRIHRWLQTNIVVPDQQDPETFMVEYEYFDRVSRTFKTYKISAAEAMTVNLPGKYVYPKYIVLPTPAVVVGPDGDEQLLNPEIICHEAEARGIATELGGHVIESTAFSGPFEINWKGEVRRRWLIILPSSTHNAAMLVRAKNSQGVGAPGEWTWVEARNHKEPRWLSHQEETGDHDPRPEIPIPCRQLFDKEAIWVGLGGTIMIYRKDMESPYNPVTPTGGGLTEYQAAQLEATLAGVNRLCEKFSA